MSTRNERKSLKNRRSDKKWNSSEMKVFSLSKRVYEYNANKKNKKEATE